MTPTSGGAAAAGSLLPLWPQAVNNRTTHHDVACKTNGFMRVMISLARGSLGTSLA
jgi:hypothetical protein